MHPQSSSLRMMGSLRDGSSPPARIQLTSWWLGGIKSQRPKFKFCHITLINLPDLLKESPSRTQGVSEHEHCHLNYRGIMSEISSKDTFSEEDVGSNDPLVVAVQLLSHGLFATPWTVARQASLPFTISQSSLKPMSTESVISSNHPILSRPPLLLLSIFPSTRVFTNESALRIKSPKYWSFSIRTEYWTSNEYSGLISFRIDWLELLYSPRDPEESSPTP